MICNLLDEPTHDSSHPTAETFHKESSFTRQDWKPEDIVKV